MIWGRWSGGGGGGDSAKAHLTDRSNKHYKFNSYYYSSKEIWQEKVKNVMHSKHV